jgi:hypothetical protein
MADTPITVEAIVSKLASARKRTKDSTLETLVTLGVTLVNPADDVVAQLIEMQGREAVRVTFTVIQQPLPLGNGRRGRKHRGSTRQRELV